MHLPSPGGRGKAQGLPARSGSGIIAEGARRGTASGAVLGAMLAYARTRGVDVAAILARVGVAPDQLEVDARVHLSSSDQAWEEAATAARDPYFGLHLSEQAAAGAFDVLDYSFNLSRTLGVAIDRFLRFQHAVSDRLALERSVRGPTTVLRQVKYLPPQQTDALFAWLAVRARSLTGTDVVPREVRFAHAAPATTVRAVPS